MSHILIFIRFQSRQRIFWIYLLSDNFSSALASVCLLAAQSTFSASCKCQIVQTNKLFSTTRINSNLQFINIQSNIVSHLPPINIEGSNTFRRCRRKKSIKFSPTCFSSPVRFSWNRRGSLFFSPIVNNFKIENFTPMCKLQANYKWKTSQRKKTAAIKQKTWNILKTLTQNFSIKL